MEVREIVAEIEKEISLLRQARALLAGETVIAEKPERATAAPGRRKRNLTPEGRKRISEALRRRWAARRKSLAKSVVPAKAAKASKRSKAAKAA